MRVTRIVFVPDKILVFLLSLKALLWIRISRGTGVSPGGAPPSADTTNTVISRCEVTVLTTAQQCHRNPIQGWNEILPPAQLLLYMIPYFQYSRCDFLTLLGVIIPETPSKNRSTGLLLEYVKDEDNFQKDNEHQISAETASALKGDVCLLIKSEIDICFWVPGDRRGL